MQVSITRTTGGHPTWPTNRLIVDIRDSGHLGRRLDTLHQALEEYLREYLDLPDDYPLSQSPLT